MRLQHAQQLHIHRRIGARVECQARGQPRSRPAIVPSAISVSPAAVVDVDEIYRSSKRTCPTRSAVEGPAVCFVDKTAPNNCNVDGISTGTQASSRASHVSPRQPDLTSAPTLATLFAICRRLVYTSMQVPVLPDSDILDDGNAPHTMCLTCTSQCSHPCFQKHITSWHRRSLEAYCLPLLRHSPLPCHRAAMSLTPEEHIVGVSY